MKDIKDYLHLYLGCEVKSNGNNTVVLYGENLQTAINSGWKPILRPLSDMTEEERDEYEEIEDDKYTGGRWVSFGHQASAVKYLLSNHFDLFGLIDAGFALDATTLKTTNEQK